jgi:hypothetical protein
MLLRSLGPSFSHNKGRRVGFVMFMFGTGGVRVVDEINLTTKPHVNQR